jgi:hypothetical protein
VQGKTQTTCHMPSTLDLRMVLDHTSHMVHVGQPFTSPHEVKTSPTPGRSLDNQRQTGPAVILGGLILPSMRQPWSRGKKFRSSGYTTTSVYWAHKHQHTISTFNTCSQGPTHRSLTNTGGGYNLGGVDLPHTTPRPSQSAISTST